jgi:hypothetical protein
VKSGPGKSGRTTGALKETGVAKTVPTVRGSSGRNGNMVADSRAMALMLMNNYIQYLKYRLSIDSLFLL